MTDLLKPHSGQVVCYDLRPNGQIIGQPEINVTYLLSLIAFIERQGPFWKSERLRSG